MSKSHPIGSLEHAMSYAVQCLGVETVAGICGRSPSAIYRGINPDDPLKLSWLTVAHVEALGQALLGRNKPEFFSSAIRQQIENEALPEGHEETSESPIMTLAEASEQLSRALRLIAGSLGRGDKTEVLRVEQTLMVVEALENAMGYAKRAKLAVLRHTHSELSRQEATTASGFKPSAKDDRRTRLERRQMDGDVSSGDERREAERRSMADHRLNGASDKKK